MFGQTVQNADRFYDNLVVRDTLVARNDPAGLLRAQLQGPDGASYVNFDQAGSDTLVQSLEYRGRLVKLVTDWKGVDKTGALDSTAGIQQAVDDSQGQILEFPPGTYLISAPIVIKKTMVLRGADCFPLVTILLNTTNQDGFQLGDGTSTTRDLVSTSVIEGFNFVPGPNCGTCTSGAALALNFVFNVRLRNCQVYGADGENTRRLFNGLSLTSVEESDFFDFQVQKMAGSALYCVGLDNVTKRSVDDNFVNWRIFGTDGDCVYFGSYTGGIVFNQLICYSGSNGAYVHLKGTVGETTPQNFFFFQPDLEVSGGASAGFLIERSNLVQIIGGWIGGENATPGVWFDANTDSSVVSTVSLVGQSIRIDGPGNAVVGCDVVGNKPSDLVGILLNAGAVNSAVGGGTRVRQWNQFGIRVVGNPQGSMISDCLLSANTAAIQGNWGTSGSYPAVRGCVTNGPTFVTAAATLPLDVGQSFIQVTGATAISAMTLLCPGQRIVIQAGAGGITFNKSSTLILSAANDNTVTVPQFRIIEFACDGGVWFQLAQNF